MVGGRPNRATQSHHNVNGVIYSNSESDGSNDVGTKVEFCTGEAHKTEEHKEGKNIRDHGNQSNTDREKHGRHKDEDDTRGQRQTLNLAVDNITSCASQEYQIPSRADRQFRGKMSTSESFDSLHKSSNITGARERGPH